MRGSGFDSGLLWSGLEKRGRSTRANTKDVLSIAVGYPQHAPSTRPVAVQYVCYGTRSLLTVNLGVSESFLCVGRPVYW